MRIVCVLIPTMVPSPTGFTTCKGALGLIREIPILLDVSKVIAGPIPAARAVFP